MNFRERLERRVNEQSVAEVLRCIATRPNKRDRPIPGDLPGKFDFWFDGGAARIITGWTEYEFTNGTRAIVGVLEGLSVTVSFPDGARVRVTQDSWGRQEAG